MNERRFSKDELSKYNGKGDAKVYIAYKGDVYDVSDSYFWKGGKHWVLHTAGLDLTDELDQAPHGEEMVKKYPIVGILQSSKEE